MSKMNLRSGLVAVCIGAMASTGMVAVAGADYTPNPPVPPGVTPTNFTSSVATTLRVGETAYYSIGTTLEAGSTLSYTVRGNTSVTFVPPEGQVIFTISALVGPSLSSSSFPMTGLPNYGTYPVSISGTTASSGHYSGTVSVTVKPAGTVSTAPRNVKATSGDSTANLTWTPPQKLGGSPITDYVVEMSTDGGAFAATACTGTALSCSFSGLANGSMYTFRVAATNAYGTSNYSAISRAVTPKGLPSVPLNVTAVAGRYSAMISWNSPATDGGSMIKRYVVTGSPGGASCTYKIPTKGPITNQCKIGGLTYGLNYTFDVVAISGGGRTSAPATSNTVTPLG